MDSKLYNHKIKEEFLSGYQEFTKATYTHTLSKAMSAEQLKDKDLFNFNLEELKEVFFELNPNTINSAISNGSIIKTYISWAIENGHRQSNINPLSTIQSSWYEQFVDKTKKLYITDEELDYIISKLVNAQDAVILMLLFLGVRGYEASEILNLKKEDIDWENGVLKLNDERNGERKLVLNKDDAEKQLRLLRQALNEKEYQKRNGESESRNPVLRLVESDFVVRNSITRGEERATRFVVNRRVAMIKEVFDFSFLTPVNIEKSGMIKLAYDIYVRDGELENKQIKEVLKHFNVMPKVINGSETYQYTLYRPFLNIETIEELYPIK